MTAADTSVCTQHSHEKAYLMFTTTKIIAATLLLSAVLAGGSALTTMAANAAGLSTPGSRDLTMSPNGMQVTSVSDNPDSYLHGITPDGTRINF